MLYITQSYSDNTGLLQSPIDQVYFYNMFQYRIERHYTSRKVPLKLKTKSNTYSGIKTTVRM